MNSCDKKQACTETSLTTDGGTYTVTTDCILKKDNKNYLKIPSGYDIELNTGSGNVAKSLSKNSFSEYDPSKTAPRKWFQGKTAVIINLKKSGEEKDSRRIWILEMESSNLVTKMLTGINIDLMNYNKNFDSTTLPDISKYNKTMWQAAVRPTLKDSGEYRAEYLHTTKTRTDKNYCTVYCETCECSENYTISGMIYRYEGTKIIPVILITNVHDVSNFKQRDGSTDDTKLKTYFESLITPYLTENKDSLINQPNSN